MQKLRDRKRLSVKLHVTFPGMWWQVMYKITWPPGQNFFQGLSSSCATLDVKFIIKGYHVCKLNVEVGKNFLAKRKRKKRGGYIQSSQQSLVFFSPLLSPGSLYFLPLVSRSPWLTRTPTYAGYIQSVKINERGGIGYPQVELVVPMTINDNWWKSMTIDDHPWQLMVIYEIKSHKIFRHRLVIDFLYQSINWHWLILMIIGYQFHWLITPGLAAQETVKWSVNFLSQHLVSRVVFH